MSKIKLSDLVVEKLYNQGVRHVFELSGGMVAHFIDSLYHFKKIDVVTMHHEQSVAFAVDGYSRVSRVPAVGLGTSGPGAINLLTGIGSCYFDSVPSVFIVGQVNRHERKGAKNIRQLGFQETDIASMALPICKKIFVLEDPNEIESIIEESFHVAQSGRCGPVLIEIPMDLQRAIIDRNSNVVNYEEKTKLTSLNDEIEAIVSDIGKAKKPLILVGRGIRSSGAIEEFGELMTYLKIPVVSSLHAIDVLPYSHPCRSGFIGTYGNRWANAAIGQSDLLLVLGSRLDIRQTGADTSYFENRKIYHVDIEREEINNRLKNCIPVNADLRDFLRLFLAKLKNVKLDLNISDWFEEIQENRLRWPDTEELKGINGINPNKFIMELSQSSYSANTKAYLADVGNHQMWSAQSLRLYKEQLFITSGGMGAMGHCFPASIGVSLAMGKAPVVSISGDGGFQLNIQELQTVIRNNIPLKIIVLNNESLGMIRQFQDTYFEGNHQSTIIGYNCPDFEKVSLAYGIDSATIFKEEEVEEGIKKLWEKPNEPFLLQVMIHPHTNCFPKIAFGKPLDEMEPLAKPIDFEGT